MKQGKILYAKHNGTYVLKFLGDIRATMCTSIDAFLDVMFADATLDGIMVDLSETDAIDSTGMGLLVKIAMQLQQLGCLRPTILSPNDDITHVLNSMSLSQVFTILTETFNDQNQGHLVDLTKLSNPSEQKLAQKVLEAHHFLIELSEQNKETFKDVVSMLEAEKQKRSDNLCKGI